MQKIKKTYVADRMYAKTPPAAPETPKDEDAPKPEDLPNMGQKIQAGQANAYGHIVPKNPEMKQYQKDGKPVFNDDGTPKMFESYPAFPPENMTPSPKDKLYFFLQKSKPELKKGQTPTKDGTRLVYDKGWETIDVGTPGADGKIIKEDKINDNGLQNRRQLFLAAPAGFVTPDREGTYWRMSKDFLNRVVGYITKIGAEKFENTATAPQAAIDLWTKILSDPELKKRASSGRKGQAIARTEVESVMALKF